MSTLTSTTTNSEYKLGRTRPDRPFTIITGHSGRYYLTEYDEVFSQCDTSLLIPSSQNATPAAVATASAGVEQIKKRVIRARSDDLPEIWYVNDRDDQTYKMGFNVSVQASRANGGAIHGCRVHGQSSLDQVDQLRSEREEWIDEMMNHGNLSTDPEEKSMISHILKSIPQIKDDTKAEKDMMSMMKSKLGLMWDYAIMPEITSRNYYLLQDSQDQHPMKRTAKHDDISQSINGAVIDKIKSNDKYESTFIEDPNGNLNITTHINFDSNSNSSGTGEIKIKTRVTKDDISMARSRDEWINKVYSRGKVDIDTDRSVSLNNQINSLTDKIDDPRFKDHLIKTSKSALGHLHDLKYYQARQ
ncbi:hypothetical protein L486_07708 [Kwoniella mangroviensis CBS 10435]|uniref:Uncharacterized protein n=1 Tax=Kwoniella mangroviensis CBS 10435 TaxID=1331196 RepID=A0A1B9IG77_9TREE|nr:hypothetical protein L486_07708 [Kwoniella mangroviensis CBS 10435]